MQIIILWHLQDSFILYYFFCLFFACFSSVRFSFHNLCLFVCLEFRLSAVVFICLFIEHFVTHFSFRFVSCLVLIFKRHTQSALYRALIFRLLSVRVVLRQRRRARGVYVLCRSICFITHMPWHAEAQCVRCRCVYVWERERGSTGKHSACGREFAGQRD